MSRLGLAGIALVGILAGCQSQGYYPAKSDYGGYSNPRVNVPTEYTTTIVITPSSSLRRGQMPDVNRLQGIQVLRAGDDFSVVTSIEGPSLKTGERMRVTFEECGMEKTLKEEALSIPNIGQAICVITDVIDLQAKAIAPGTHPHKWRAYHIGRDGAVISHGEYNFQSRGE